MQDIMVNKQPSLLSRFRAMDVKHQAKVTLEFIIGYFSPLLGLMLFTYMKVKGKEKLYQYSGLMGASVALIFYAVTFLTYILAI